MAPGGTVMLFCRLLLAAVTAAVLLASSAVEAMPELVKTKVLLHDTINLSIDIHDTYTK